MDFTLVALGRFDRLGYLNSLQRNGRISDGILI
jgi:hypothetical protein